MTEQGKILVTGATGNVGGQVVSQLLDAGAAVRAFVRDPDTAGRKAGVEVVKGDLSEPKTLEAALEGVASVFLMWPFFAVEGTAAVVEAIAKHARRLVYLSSEGVRGGAREQADPINGCHADLERLIERSGLEWTFLRAAPSRPTPWAGLGRSALAPRPCASPTARRPGRRSTSATSPRWACARSPRTGTTDGSTS